MNGLNEGRNISRGINEGAAQVWDFSPAIRTAQMIYQNEERKRQLAAKQYEDLISTYDPKRAKLRSADVPEYLEQYKTFADAKRAMASGLVKDRTQLAALQNQADKAAGEMQTIAALSQEAVNTQKNVLTGYMQNSDQFHPQTSLIMGAYDATPSRQLAAGKLKGVDDNVNPFMGKNLLNAAAYLDAKPDPKTWKDFITEADETKIESKTIGGKAMQREVVTTMPKETAEVVMNRFNVLAQTSPKTMKFYSDVLMNDMKDGTADKVKDWAAQQKLKITPEQLQNPGSYFALKNLMEYQPRIKKQGEWDFTAAQKLANQRELAEFTKKMEAQYKSKEDENNVLWLRKWLQDNTPYEINTLSPFVLAGKLASNTEGDRAPGLPKGNKMQMNPVFAKALAYPDALEFNPYTKKYIVTYYKQDAAGNPVINRKTGLPEVDEKRGSELTEDDLLMSLSNEIKATKRTDKEMSNNAAAGDKTKTVESSTNVNVEGGRGKTPTTPTTTTTTPAPKKKSNKAAPKPKPFGGTFNN